MVTLDAVLLPLVLGFGCASYLVGCRAVLAGRYAPNTFSRVVWLLLAVVSTAGVVGGGGGPAAVLLSGVFLAGNAAMCLLSLRRGTRGLGRVELGCLALLVVSGVVWVVFDAPVVSLAVSLLAHAVGGAPTYRAVWRDPGSESAGFWSLFLVASALSLLGDLGRPLPGLLFPAWFVLFDGGMTALSLRRRGRRAGPVRTRRGTTSG